MMKTKYYVLLSSLFCVNALAAPLQGIYFQHKDWETACDNTGTCRVAGYHHEDEGENLISVSLTRQAGSPKIWGELTVRHAKQVRQKFGEN